MNVTIELIQTINYILGLGGILTIVATLFLVYDLTHSRKLAPLIARFGILVALMVTVCSSALTLVYSEIFGLIPCGLCWLERMALYPQVLMILVGHYKRDASYTLYGIALSAVGFIVSLYHHYLQMGGTQFIKCPAAGAGADCAKRFFFEFGFMTFPLMATFLFAFLVALYLYMRKINNNLA